MFLLVKLNYLVPRVELFKKEDIERLVRILATRLNDAAIAWVPFESKELWVELYRIGSIEIRIASADLILAMKLKADRGVRDRSDIEGLIQLIGINNIEEIEVIYERFYDQEILSDLTRAVVVGMLIGLRSSNGS